MSKLLGKLKATKEKSKREKSVKNDDGQTFRGFKEKEKDKTRGKNSIKKKNASQHLGEDLSVEDLQDVLENPAPAVREKLKKSRVSKSCEQTVNKAVAEFFECAWVACAERFFITTAPITVSFELRNTWLRILEMEWLDPAIKENKSAMKNNKIFKRDNAPLPLAFDSWSRGALESLPRVRRESVIDPFLRDINNFTQFSFPERLTTLSVPQNHSIVEALYTSDNESSTETPEDIFDTLVHGIGQTLGANSIVTEEDISDSPAEVVPEKDRWTFELDPKVSFDFEHQLDPVVEGLLPDTDYAAESQESSEPEFEIPQVTTVLSAKAFGFDESTTDRDELSSPDSKQTNGKSENVSKSNVRKSNVRKSKVPKPPQRRFSPGQCGGKTGSGVFLLPLETTSEALLRMKKSFIHKPVEAPLFTEPNEQDVLEENSDQLFNPVERPSQSTYDEDEGSIQPLFTERGTTIVPGNQSKARSVNELQNAIPSLNRMASDIEKKFLTRRLANLHRHFRRQTKRALVARAKQREAALAANRVPSPTSSIVLSKASTAPSNKSEALLLRGGNRAKSTISDPHVLGSGQKRQRKSSGNVHSSDNDNMTFRSFAGTYNSTASQQKLRNEFENAKLSRIRRKHGNIKKSCQLLQSPTPSYCVCATVDSCSLNRTPP